MPRVLPAVLMAAAAAFPAHAADWGQLATISSTLGVNANRLCVGEGLRSDIGCPSYAPYVSATSGGVGIGTTDTSYPITNWSSKLAVSGNSIFRSGRLAFENGSGDSHLQFFNGTTWEGSYVFTPAGTGQHLFYVHSSVTPVMAIGNAVVGIGTVTPSAPLNIHNGAANGVGAKMVLSRHYSGSSLNAASGISHYLQSGLTNDMMLFGVTGDGGSNGDPTTLANTKMVLSAAGRLGLGTLSPTAKLEVNGDISATNLRLSGNLYVSGSQTFDGVTFANGGVSATGIITATSFSGDGSQLTGLASGDRITSGTTSAIAYNGGSITFTTANSQRMIIGGTGNIGIGTVSPLGLFDARSSTGQFLLANSSAPSIGQTAMLLLAPSTGFLNTTYWNRAPAIAGVQEDGLNFSGLAFYTYIGGNQVEKVRINKNGNVGIGTSSTVPGYALDVRGNSRFDNGVTLANGTTDLMKIARVNITDMGFFVNATTERMRISSGGNVGIGTTSPAKTLDVSGTAQIVSRTLVGGTGTPSATFQVSGSLLLAGNDNIPCTASVLGLVRRNPTTGRLQACR